MFIEPESEKSHRSSGGARYGLFETKYFAPPELQSSPYFGSINISPLRDSSDFVDALIAATAERLNIKRLLTLDRRDFQLIRPKHCEGFELLP